jgi:hypothetical protein
VWAATSDDDDIGRLDPFESERGDETEAGLRGEHGALFQRADAEIEIRQADGGSILAIDKAWHGEVERADAVESDGGDDWAGHDSVVPILSYYVNRATFGKRRHRAGSRHANQGEQYGQHRK